MGPSFNNDVALLRWGGGLTWEGDAAMMSWGAVGRPRGGASWPCLPLLGRRRGAYRTRLDRNVSPVDRRTNRRGAGHLASLLTWKRLAWLPLWSPFLFTQKEFPGAEK